MIDSVGVGSRDAACSVKNTICGCFHAARCVLTLLVVFTQHAASLLACVSLHYEYTEFSFFVGSVGGRGAIDFAKIRNPYPACQGFHEVFSKFLQVFLRRRKRLPRNAFTLGARGGGSRSVSQSVSCLKSGTRGVTKN